jgi:UDP-GlcNAc:undecaprenyl-phosphate GlcNAc-1-phosphate transferase
MSFLLALAVASAVLAVGGSLLARSLSPRIGAIAHPRYDRWNADPVPLLGGPAIAISVAVTLAFVPNLPSQIWILLGGAMALTIVGLVDDLEPLRPYTKLTAQFVVAGVVTAMGLRFPFSGSAIADVIITMVWMVGLTNAFNLLDNMDGLAAGVAAIAGIVKLSLFAYDGNWSGAATCAAFVGACAGFLVFNFHPARLFMGDAGSMFLGFFIAGLSAVGGSPDSRAIVSVLIAPVAVMLVPIFDTSFVTVMRLLARRPISKGGKDHLSHRLVKAGLSPRLAVLTLYALAAIAGFIGFVTRGAGLRVGAALLGALAVATFILGVTLARIRIYPDVVTAPVGGVPLQRAPGLSYIRQVATVGIDGLLVLLSYYAVYAAWYAPSDIMDTPFLQSLPIVFSCKMAALAVFRGHMRMWRYTSTHDLLALAEASTVGSVLAVLAILFLHNFAGYSRAVFALDWLLFLGLLASSRLMLRGLSEVLRPGPDAGARVLIYGAGNGGVALLEKLRRNADLGRVVVGFLDDDVLKQRTRVQGLPVFGGVRTLPNVLARRRIQEVIISTTRLAPERVAQVRTACDAAGVPVSLAYIRIERLPRDSGARRTIAI